MPGKRLFEVNILAAYALSLHYLKTCLVKSRPWASSSPRSRHIPSPDMDHYNSATKTIQALSVPQSCRAHQGHCRHCHHTVPCRFYQTDVSPNSSRIPRHVPLRSGETRLRKTRGKFTPLNRLHRFLRKIADFRYLPEHPLAFRHHRRCPPKADERPRPCVFLNRLLALLRPA